MKKKWRWLTALFAVMLLTFKAAAPAMAAPVMYWGNGGKAADFSNIIVPTGIIMSAAPAAIVGILVVVIVIVLIIRSKRREEEDEE